MSAIKNQNRIAIGGAILSIILLLLYFLLPETSRPLIAVAFGLLAIGEAAIIYRLPRTTATAFTLPLPDSTSAPADYSPTKLEELITHIHVTADGLVRAAEAINEVTVQQSSGASQQAEVIQLTNNLMDDFLKLSERINTQAQSVTETAKQAADISQTGQSAIRQAIEGMDNIRTQVSAIGETIVKLATLTRRIDEIITSVSEIATQSNLLALNASIEAARAGVHGRGFSVVADEVRTLSQQSTQAAKQVRAILVEIQTAVKDTIKATESGSRGVIAGVMLTQQVNHVLVQLSQSVSASQEAIRAIYDVIRQQTDGLEEISISMDRIDRITQQNLASTRMVETVSTNLSRLATDLQGALEQSQLITAPTPN
jgi:methyl-accepting chemotaxis protein